MAAQAPEVLELLGHPIRWELALALARSDLRVGELVEQVGERQNLVSYHLGQLRRAQLVAERRSSADARDVYYRLDLSVLQAELNRLANAIHPSIQIATIGDSLVRQGGHRAARVLFVCTGNSARSQIAEVILRNLSHGAIEVHSAGPRPAAVHPLAVQVLESLGFATDGLRSKSVEEMAGMVFDHVVTLCDIAREDCAEMIGEPNRIHWSLADPAAVEGTRSHRIRAFEHSAAELRSRIRFALQVLAVPKSSDAAA